MGNEHTDDAGDIDVPVEAIQVIDPQVAGKLPKGTEVTSVTAHGVSSWTRTACIHAEVNGEPRKFFLKTSHGDRGREMMFGEFSAMTLIHSIRPQFVPKPIARGTYKTLSDVHFLLCEFRRMRDDLPDLETFPAMIADLHQNSTSPNGKFGFDVRTFHGNIPIDHGWSITWEEYFTRTTTALLMKEQEVQGANEEIMILAKPLLEKVIPRLLRPLETGGRSIKPSLIHGDLWHGNAAMDDETNRPIIFDAASFYAHNEYELAVWRQPWNKISTPYRDGYRKNFAPAHPQEDFEDRAILYATRVHILDSILFKNDSSYRQMLIESLKDLVARFSGGYEEWAKKL